MDWGCTGGSGGKATSSGLKTISSVHFSYLHALISLTQTLYLRMDLMVLYCCLVPAVCRTGRQLPELMCETKRSCSL